jgi:hypothetical protein
MKKLYHLFFQSAISAMQNTNFYASGSVLSGHMKQTYGICLLQEVFWWIQGITEISFCRFPLSTSVLEIRATDAPLSAS